MEIYPSILAYSKEEFIKKVERVRPLGLHLHLDIMDGNFVANKTWADPTEVEMILDGASYNTHLMVNSPEHLVPVWAVCRSEIVFFHYESTHRHELIIRAVTDQQKMGIAINPTTPVSEIGHLLDSISSVLVMSVTPGRSGQKFNGMALEKIKKIKKMRPNLHVVVDGGIKPHNIAKIAHVGADAAVVGSALTDSPNPEIALQELKQGLNEALQPN